MIIFLVPMTIVGCLGRERSPSLLFFAVLPLLWVALRQDLLFAASGVLLTTAVAAFALRAALGDNDLLQMQMALLTGALAALYAGAVRRTNEDLVASLIEREGRFARLVEHAPVHVLELELNGTPRLALNERSTRRDRLLGDRWHTFGPLVTSSESATTFDWNATIEGRHEWFVSSAVPLHRADGVLDSVLVVTTDRTEIEQARQRLLHEARHDELTALPTKARLLAALDERSAVALEKDKGFVSSVRLNVAVLAPQRGDWHGE